MLKTIHLREAFSKFNFMQFKFFLYLFPTLLILFSCRENKTVSYANPENQNSNLKYAKRFAIKKQKNHTLLYLFGNRLNADTTATYLIYDSLDPKTLPIDKSIKIKTPCKRVAALSSIYANMLEKLNALDQVVAIDNIDYVSNSKIVQKHAQGKLKELSRGPELDLEQTIVLNPDVVFAFGMGAREDRSLKLEESGIPFVISIDHLEESALARAEWIKFFAVFVNKEKEADSIFKTVEENYNRLKGLALLSSYSPSVFTELKYGEIWYVPGGKSFMAQMIKDAGANYLWHEDKNSGSLPLSFEQVYSKAKEADFWINLSMVTSKQEVLMQESRYDQFKAYQKGNLYNNNKSSNAFGYSDYWETGMIYPDRILSDLIQIFHPELKNQIKNDLYYYRQIK